ncbi:M3 family oligoendopeptidase [Crassaminicella thermophila]|uniref:M3 family oligoendopeptidase n=1 Tax=Crassaminicella thermophila TaxID=2599308 RepID=A0A5C0SE60_CRATE|nr:M3 family oligoendopeptidase [Crassaminicella thermophila]QEK12895.1 M3 family oligoendopeptidase [Crassaminicella thermophila]
MKFNQWVYKRPNIKEIEKEFNILLSKFTSAQDYKLQDELLVKINELRNHFESMEQIAYIRHSIDTKDPIYEEEQNFFDENKPIYEGLVSKYYNALIVSKYKDYLKKKWGEQLFNIAKLKINTFSSEVIDDLQLENKLMSEYTKLLSSAKIYFNGAYRNLPQMRPFEMSIDRDTRKKASEAKYSFFKENEEKFDDIYDRLVNVRTTIAQKLGYENFIQLGYARMLRIDYGVEHVESFRNQVKKEIVPLATKLREKQRVRLGLSKLNYYDELLNFKDGNAKPKKDVKGIIEYGKKMYEELSKETKVFFEYMLQNELMDLLSKEGKSPGGYCTYIPSYKMPFIFSNFNGTSDDIDVLTHEAGHAFQMYESRNYVIPEYSFPTLDACEIHSMSMEFFTWPWMHLFFEENADKYKFAHLTESLLFIPYGVTVDEFQHVIYANPKMQISERKAVWREIEKKYLPHRSYDENDYLERGGYWHQQGHIFKNPFYYIDYTLAGICAFQFFIKSRENWDRAWKDYLALCQAGGSKSFLGLVKLAKLDSPFDDGCVKKVTEKIEEYLKHVEDKQ